MLLLLCLPAAHHNSSKASLMSSSMFSMAVSLRSMSWRSFADMVVVLASSSSLAGFHSTFFLPAVPGMMLKIVTPLEQGVKMCFYPQWTTGKFRF